jgi:hypothetical protein
LLARLLLEPVHQDVGEAVSPVGRTHRDPAEVQLPRPHLEQRSPRQAQPPPQRGVSPERAGPRQGHGCAPAALVEIVSRQAGHHPEQAVPLEERAPEPRRELAEPALEQQGPERLRLRLVVVDEARIGRRGLRLERQIGGELCGQDLLGDPQPVTADRAGRDRTRGGRRHAALSRVAGVSTAFCHCTV